MKHGVKIFWMLLLIVTGCWAAESSDSSPLDLMQRYPNILRNNIFSRYRQPYVEPRVEETRVKPAAPSPETYYILKGIVLEGDTFIAFVEYNNQGTPQRYTEGSDIAEGTIQSLTLDGLVYMTTGKDANSPATTPVTIGQNLLGQFVDSSASQYDYGYDDTYSIGTGSTASQSSTSDTQAENSATDNSTEDILKQLMERRRRELGR